MLYCFKIKPYKYSSLYSFIFLCFLMNFIFKYFLFRYFKYFLFRYFKYFLFRYFKYFLFRYFKYFLFRYFRYFKYFLFRYFRYFKYFLYRYGNGSANSIFGNKQYGGSLAYHTTAIGYARRNYKNLYSSGLT
jgi:hypothetical protein